MLSIVGRIMSSSTLNTFIRFKQNIFMVDNWSGKLLRLTCALAGCILVAACGMNLRPAPLAASASLSGIWLASTVQRNAGLEQFRAAMKLADDKQRRSEQKRASPGRPPNAQPGASSNGAMGGPPAPGNPGGRENWEVREEREQEQALLAAVVPPESLGISQIAGRIDITPSIGAKRSFTPGEPSTLVTTFGSFYIESGWQGDEFVVHSKDAQDGIDVVERYRKQMDGNLAIAIAFSTRIMKEQQLKLVYHAASRSP